MSYRWRRARLDLECGAVIDCRIAVGDPVCEQWIRCEPDTPQVKPLLRCARHAHEPVPADLPPLDAVDAALALTPRQIRPVDARPLPFDGRMAAAGKDDEA